MLVGGDVRGARDRLELRADVGRRALDGEARDRGRPACPGRAVVRAEAGVRAAHGHLLGIDADLLGGDLRECRPRSLSHLGRADEDDDATVGLEAADRARHRVRARGEQADRDAAADIRVLLLAPADAGGHLLDVADEVGVERLSTGAHLLAGGEQVLAAQVERVEPGAPGHLVDLRLADPLQVRRAEGAVRACRGEVRVDARGVHPVRGPAVGAWSGVARGRDDARAVVRVGTGVEQALDVAREEAAVRCRRGAHPAGHVVAARRDHRLGDAVLDPHRPPGLPRERDRERLHLRVRLRSEAAAQVRHLDAHVRDRDSEQVGDLGAHEERVLAGRPERDLVALDLGDHRVRLHRVLVDGREGVLALDDDVRPREDRLELAAVDPVPVADVPVTRRDLPQAVEEAGLRLALGDELRVGGGRVRHVRDHRQLLVLDLDQLDGRGCGRHGLGRDRGDLLSVEAHLVDRQDRPVLDRVPVVGVDVVEVGAGEDADDAGHALGGRGVDRDDPAVGDRAPQHLAVQHPRDEQVADELRPRREASRARRVAAASGRCATGSPERSWSCGRELGDGLEDPTVPGAAAEVPGEVVLDLLLAAELAVLEQSA